MLMHADPSGCAEADPPFDLQVGGEQNESA
jgi:hypothetical protein